MSTGLEALREISEKLPEKMRNLRTRPLVVGEGEVYITTGDETLLINVTGKTGRLEELARNLVDLSRGGRFVEVRADDIVAQKLHGAISRLTDRVSYSQIQQPEVSYN